MDTHLFAPGRSSGFGICATPTIIHFQTFTVECQHRHPVTPTKLFEFKEPLPSEEETETYKEFRFIRCILGDIRLWVVQTSTSSCLV